jgi:hypothetical protein
MAKTLFPEGIEVKKASYFGAPIEVVGGDHDTDKFSAGRRIVDACDHRFPCSSRQLEGTAVVARTEVIFIATVAGWIESFKVQVPVAPVGGTTGFTADLQKSAGGTAFATVLSAPITVNDTNTADREIEVATLADDEFDAGDVYRVVWALVGSGGTQAQGAIAQADFVLEG